MDSQCRWCDQPHTEHPRYTAGIGDHQWEPRAGDRVRQIADIDRSMRLNADKPAPGHAETDGRLTATPRPVRADDGGLTLDWEPDAPSDRPRREPTYQTGRVPAELQPNPAEAFQQELIRKRPFLGPALDAAARDIQKQDRPGVLRRILNATKRSST